MSSVGSPLSDGQREQLRAVAAALARIRPLARP